MGNNIFAGTNYVFYVSTQVGRLKGEPLLGEVDLRSLFTAANTLSIYSVKNGVIRVFSPARVPTSSLDVLTPGDLYALVARVDFEVNNLAPSSNAGFYENLLAYLTTATAQVGDVLDGKLPNVPVLKRYSVSTAVTAGSLGKPWAPLVLADTLGVFRTWLSFEPTATKTEYNQYVSEVESWGSSVDGAVQSNASLRPYLRVAGLEFTINPPGWLSMNLDYLTGSNYTIFICERREGINSGFVVAGSQTASATNIQIGYADEDSFVFNRLGGSDLSVSVPTEISSEFVIWTLRFDGSLRSIWRNGTKVGEVADTNPLSDYEGAALGYFFEPSYIGTLRHFMVAASSITDGQIAQVTSFLQAYNSLFPSSGSEVIDGSISITSPTSNSVIAIGESGLAEVYIQGSFVVEEGELSAIESKLGSGLFEVAISRPPGPDYLALIKYPVSNGDLTVRFAGNASVSATASNITVVDARPTSLDAIVTGVDLKSVQVTWNAPAGVTVTSYVVGISTNRTTWVEQVVSPVVGTAQSYTFANLTAGFYSYRVKSSLTTSESPYVTSAIGEEVEIAATSNAVLNNSILTQAVSIWELDDTTWADRKGLTTLTPISTPTIGTALCTPGSGSLQLSGTNYLDTSDGTKYRLEGTKTIVMCFKNSGTNPSSPRLGTLFCKGNAASTTGSRSWDIGTDHQTSGDRVVVRLSNNGTSTTQSIQTPYITAKSLGFIVVQWSQPDSLFRMKINNGSWITGVFTTVHQPNAISAKIGAKLDGSAVIASPFIGTIDNVMWINGLLTDEEISYLWNNGAPIQLF